jgi:hypothetical protein
LLLIDIELRLLGLRCYLVSHTSIFSALYEAVRYDGLLDQRQYDIIMNGGLNEVNV